MVSAHRVSCGLLALLAAVCCRVEGFGASSATPFMLSDVLKLCLKAGCDTQSACSHHSSDLFSWQLLICVLAAPMFHAAAMLCCAVLLGRYSIVEGAHPMWGGVSEPYKHMIRAFLVHFQLQILSQVSQEREFNFKNGSIGEVA